MRWIYNILFTVVFWVASPWLFIKLRRRGAWREAFMQRFGCFSPGALPPTAPGRLRLWLHAVSVGEVNTCLQFLKKLMDRLPHADIIVSTTTNTGMAELRRKLPRGVTPIYFPVDLRWCVRKALRAAQPNVVILVEREIWPNFLWELQARGIPLFLINARISTRSYRLYQRYGFLFRKLYSQFVLATAQTEADAQRLRGVGCRHEIQQVLGNMKFDATPAGPGVELDAADLLRQAGKPPDAIVLVAGSTHNGEELLLARVTQRLRKEFPNLFLVLVPRHFERASEVMEQLLGAGIAPTLRSSLGTCKPAPPMKDPCLLVDSTGELMAFYAQADVVFIGKSICARGGQNPIEPASLGKPLVFGPHMGNFPGVTQQLVTGRAAIQVAGEAQLEDVLGELMRLKELRMEMGHNALDTVCQNQGATQRTVDLVVQALERLPPRA